MLRRRVPVLRLGSRGHGGDQKSLRKRSQAFASVGECRAFLGVEKRREAQNYRHFLRLAFQKCEKSQGSGASWSRNAELSTLDWRWVFKSVNNHRDGGGRGREMQNCPHFWTGVGSSRFKSVNNHRDGGRCGRETQSCNHFWTRVGSFLFKSVSSHRDGGVVVAKRRAVVAFRLALGLRVSKVSTLTGMGGFWSRNAELSSLWDLPLACASQKCQSQGLGVSWSRNAELSSLLDLRLACASQKCQQSQGSGGGALSQNAELSSLEGESRGGYRERRLNRERRGERREEGREKGKEERR